MPLSVLLRPVSVFWYITGTTIKNAMNTDRFFAVNHIRHITTKDATGTVWFTMYHIVGGFLAGLLCGIICTVLAYICKPVEYILRIQGI